MKTDKLKTKHRSTSVAVAIVYLYSKNPKIYHKFMEPGRFKSELVQEASCIAQQLYVENLLGE